MIDQFIWRDSQQQHIEQQTAWRKEHTLMKKLKTETDDTTGKQT